MRRPVAIVLLAFACASPPPVDTRAGSVRGYVRLTPKSGTTPAGDAYADRRVRDAARFDYTRPKFAVVYAAGAPPRRGAAQKLTIEDGRSGPHWTPALAAIADGESLQIVNRSARPHVVSAPLANFAREIAPGETVAITPLARGELEIHTLDARASAALVWVAPGSFAIADAAGRYELRGLAPGRVDIRAWHPRLPPSPSHTLEVREGTSTRLDLEIGVDQMVGEIP